MDEQIQELADAIYTDKVRRAREAPLSRKMGWGAELFSEVCGRMRVGIRAQFPEADEKEVEECLRKRLDRLSKMEEVGIFQRAEKK